MAKIRQNTRNKDKTTTTTPLNNINGKVHKVRVNVKTMKNATKSKEEASKTNPVDIDNQLFASKTSLRSEKLRCTRINDISNNNKNNNVNHTLQAQCKVNERIVKVSKNIEKTTRSKKNGTQNKIKENFSHVSNVKNLNKNEAAIEIQNSISDVEKSNDKINAEPIDIVCKTPKSTRRCIIKLQKTPSPTSLNKAKENDFRTLENVPFTRKCRVKLRKIQDESKTNEPLTPSTKRKCVVRLQRTPITHGRNKSRVESSESSPHTSQLPVIDQNKRNNFHKLSLTKSFRKSTENNRTITNNFNPEQEIEHLSNNHNSEKQVIELNNNEPKHTNNLVNQLKIQNGLKYRSKLSLRKSSRSILKNVVNNLEITQFEPQQNSTICFEPTRNSTLLEFGFTKDKNKENIDPKEIRATIEDKSLTKNNSASKNKSLTKDKSLSNDKSSSQNLANKSEEIVNILNSLDEDDIILLKSPERNDNEQEKQNNVGNNTSPKNNRTHKFFNRSKEDQQNTLSKDENNSQIKSPAKPKEVSKKRRLLTKRSTVAKKDNIYEFLSQSQTSDSDNNTKQTDPTADIIKKLIEQGKVRVATNCKGKGKPIFKRKVPPPKQMKKLKQPADKKLTKIRNNQPKYKTGKANKNKDNGHDNNGDEDEVIVEHFEDHFDNEDLLPDVDYNMENQGNISLTKRPSNISNKSDAPEGTLSRLARTVLINQASRSDAQRKNASLLLNKVKQIISTPKNKVMHTPQLGLQSDLSPIAMPLTRPATIPSPWRVNEDAYLPKTFNFSRSSGNLPSFSSDFIPATPRKEKPNNNVTNAEQQMTINSERPPVISNQNSIPSIPHIQSLEHSNMDAHITPVKEIQNENDPSVISSFSSNDSNAENMPPPRPLVANFNENEDIFNMKQLPNPRRALSYRSPLKNINILEVVHLPTLKNINKTPKTNDIDMFGFEENLVEDSIHAEQSIVDNNVSESSATNKKRKSPPKEDLFGFEDFLSQTEYSSQDNEESNNHDKTNAQNITIHDKLRDLRKLKPAENELQLNLQKEKSSKTSKPLPLFDDESAANLDGMRQRGIKEMLCSTLIDVQPSTSKEALRELRKRNLQNSNRPKFGEDLEISELFKDPEPETTFNENDAHRTYIRPYKRKRRLKENKFVMFLDSDASDDEDTSNERRKNHHQHSHETDTSSEQQQAPKKKRQRKEPKERPELKEFVEEFNEMCKEVVSFELIVEKSA